MMDTYIRDIIMTLSKYLSTASESDRIIALEELANSNQGISLELAEALIQLPISDIEKFKVIESVLPENGLTWELFLVDGILNWPQNISAQLIQIWANKTSRILHPLIKNENIKHELPQRVFYTIVDLVSPYIGKDFYESYAKSEAISDYSPALHGLMMLRGVQFNSTSTNIMTVAQKYLDSGLNNKYADSKGFLESIIYYARFNPEVLKNAASGTNCDPWNSLLNSVAFYANHLNEYLPEIENKISEVSSTHKFNNLWPILPFRHILKKDIIVKALVFTCKHEEFYSHQSKIFDVYSGCDSTELAGALDDLINSKQVEPEHLSSLIEGLYGLLGYYENTKPSATVTQFMHEHDYLESAHKHLFFDKHSEKMAKFVSDFKSNPTFKKGVEYEQHTDCQLNFVLPKYKTTTRSEFRHTKELHWVSTALYSPNAASLKSSPKPNDDFWRLLIDGIKNQTKDNLEKLAIEARKQPYLVNLCFLRTLGLYEGNNEAALRLMDYARSKNEIEVGEVILSLAGINTPRSLQELIGCITRSNLTETIQLEACRLLHDKDVESLQPEIKAALNDLEMKKDRNESWYEIRDLLKSLLKTQVEKSPVSIIAPEKPAVDLDESLNKKIPHYQNLSSEVKRALRTGQFFYDQVTGPNSTENIEISPIIDMVYKSLELQFRESFEDLALTLIKNGVLQRKLDIIGYARPIPKQMDAFEDYISKLDIIKEIPFFSKFKLRKMLRALCQYKPGKRFTLDGIKAFALFFLCFSRKECQYGLDGLLNLGFNRDSELFEFVKSLHVLQDFRNRAVHEGFRPEARNDIEGIWNTAGGIYEQAYIISSFLNEKDATSRTAG